MSLNSWVDTYQDHVAIAGKLREILAQNGLVSTSDIKAHCGDRNPYRVKQYLLHHELIDFAIMSDYDRNKIEKCQKLTDLAAGGSVTMEQAAATLALKDVPGAYRRMRALGLKPPPVERKQHPDNRPVPEAAQAPPPPPKSQKIQVGDRLRVAGMPAEYRGHYGNKPRFLLL